MTPPGTLKAALPDKVIATLVVLELTSVRLRTILAVLAPTEVGANAAETVQLPFAASDAPQLFVNTNCPASMPVIFTAVMVNVLPPMLVSVTV
jgi:hypothetical protein